MYTSFENLYEYGINCNMKIIISDKNLEILSNYKIHSMLVAVNT